MSEQKPTGEWTCGGDDMQPKPTTGKWTPRHVQAICEKGYADDLTPEQAEVIADAHNAELAAERERGQQECDRLDAFWQNQTAQLREQLAAEEQKNITLHNRLIDLEEQLATERKKNLAVSVEGAYRNQSVRPPHGDLHLEAVKRELAAEREKVRALLGSEIYGLPDGRTK